MATSMKQLHPQPSGLLWTMGIPSKTRRKQEYKIVNSPSLLSIPSKVTCVANGSLLISTCQSPQDSSSRLWEPLPWFFFGPPIGNGPAVALSKFLCCTPLTSLWFGPLNEYIYLPPQIALIRFVWPLLPFGTLTSTDIYTSLTLTKCFGNILYQIWYLGEVLIG